ncbi:hypothetical protein BBJ28_00001918 [Nothophytophthora sp. Chile5]|nr:hypothetical protein BBJ28_00001918 [Nothophytophthora sp. Chile5]
MAPPRRLSPGSSAAPLLLTPSSTSPSSPPPPPPPPPKLRGGRSGRPSSKFGTVNYSVDEMRRLNAKVRAVLPLAGDDWLHVAYQFNYLRPEAIPYREVESLKRKFKKMYCSRSAAGRLPDYVVEAKDLRRLINQRTDKAAAGGDDAGDDVATRTRSSSNGSSSSGSRSARQVSALMDATQKAGGDQLSLSTAGEEAATADEAEATLRPDADTRPSEAALSTQHLLPEADDARRKPQSGELAVSSALQDAEAEAARDIALKLRQMEEEYHRTLESKQPGASSVDRELAVNTEEQGVEASAAAAGTHMDSPQAALQLQSASSSSWNSSAASTSGIIAMLRHSVERKRRTVEEQMLSESARVRRERKKRKMEQVLLSIHHEHRERELAGGSGAVSAEAAAAGEGSTPVGTPPASATHSSHHPPPSPSRQQLLSPFAAGSASPSSFFSMAGLGQPPALQDVGVMELLLQFMTAQQAENMQRVEAEKTRREQERREREERRRQKERQRRQDHRELMLAMAALLGDRFPDALAHHLGQEDQQLAAPAASEAPVRSESRAAPQANCSAGLDSSQPPAAAAAAIAADRSDLTGDNSSGDSAGQTREQHAEFGVDEATTALL